MAVRKKKPFAAPRFVDCWTLLGLNSGGPGPTLLKLSDLGKKAWRATIDKAHQERVAEAKGPDRDRQLTVLEEARQEAYSVLQEDDDNVHWFLRD